MLGAIIGDIVGSRFEWNNIKSKEFEFLTYKCFLTDDSIMTLALAQAVLVSKPDYSDLSQNAVKCMQSVGRNYPDCGYGGRFRQWMFSSNPQPTIVMGMEPRCALVLQALPPLVWSKQRLSLG